MSTGKGTLPESNGTNCCYLQDDIARGLRASLMAVLATALAGGWANFEFLKGVFSLASSQAALYGIHWTELVANLHDAPELEGLTRELQDGKRTHLARRVEHNTPC